MCAVSSTMSSVPRRPRIESAIWFAIVAVGRYTASSCPRNAAARCLEREHGRILAPLLVADLGGGHRRAHPGRRRRLRVRAEVDHGAQTTAEIPLARWLSTRTSCLTASRFPRTTAPPITCRGWRFRRSCSTRRRGSSTCRSLRNSGRPLHLSALRPARRAAASGLERDSRRARLHASELRVPRPCRRVAGARCRCRRALGPASRRPDRVRRAKRDAVPGDLGFRAPPPRRTEPPDLHRSGLELYSRMAIVARDGRIEKVFYPVFPPDRNAADVVAYLTGTVTR